MNSVLNPEAPEFHPLLTNVVKDGFACCSKSVYTTRNFPIGATHDYYKTYTEYGKIKRQISDNVVTQSNQIVVAELPAVKLQCNLNNINNTEKIKDVNDSLLDRININIDTLTGVNKASDEFIKNIKAKNISPWNTTPIIARIKVGGTTFIGGKNIPRPQLNFKDPVDNSYNLWVPKISDKPNNIKPLALNILYTSDGVAAGYEHPYSIELDQYQPPAHFIKADTTPPVYPPDIKDTTLTLVDTEAKLDELVKHLQDCEEIAVDVEHHSFRSYQGITCLIQITTHQGGDFLIDTIAIREHIHKLNHSFTDPKKIKIFHGADNDVKWLQRDFGVYIVGLFDTFQAGKILKLPFLSLKNLLTSYCQVETDKKYQMADWRIRPLPSELVYYARMDTHYLLYMWRVMKQQLLDKAGQRPQLLLSAFEYSRQTCCLTYNKEVMDDYCHMELFTRSKKRYNNQQLSALKVLYKWRDARARELDEGTSYLIPNHMLLNLAEKLPREIEGINACCAPTPPFVKLNIVAIHKMILSCRELPLETISYDTPVKTKAMELKMKERVNRIICNIHDTSQMREYTEDDINLDLAWMYDQNVLEVDGVKLDVQPEVEALAAPTVRSTPARDNLSAGVVSKLNANAHIFIPPYDRYRASRALCQEREIATLKEKESKVAALCDGNELIKTEVLLKLQKQRIEAEAHMVFTEKLEPGVERTKHDEKDEKKTNEIVEKAIEEEKATKKASQRKRKIEKATAIQPADDKKKEPQKNYTDDSKVKSFHYKNVNYKKFHSQTDTGHKLPKMKFKKP